MNIMKNRRAVIAVAALMLGSFASQAAIDLASPTTNWRPILFAYGNYVDPTSDQQTGQGQADIVGDLAHPGAYWQFDGAGTPSLTDGELAFRMRLRTVDTGNSFSNYALFGIDGHLDGSLDYFVTASQSNNRGGINIIAAGTGANTSPSTTSLSNTAFYNEAISTTNYLYTAVTTTNDPGATTNIGGTTNYFISWKVPFQKLVDAFAATSLAINENSSLRFVVATATQLNSLNQDIGGINGGVNSTTLFKDLGVISTPLSSSGSDPLLWLGNFSTEWSNNNITTNKNWTTNDPKVPPINPGYLDDLSLRLDFAAKKDVTFDDRATIYATNKVSGAAIVNINISDVSPSSVYINNSTLNYVYQSANGYGITGTNSVIKVGTGIATFKNANSYSGGTSLTGGGTISIHGGSALGSGGIAVGTGTLDFAGTSSYTLANTILDDAALTMSVTNASPVTASGPIGGAGTLAKTGSGTLILTGNNEYGGATSINGGTLQIGNGATAGTLGTNTVASISNSGTLAVNRSDNVELKSVVTGTGGLSQLGSGVLGLTAANNYSGITRIQAGTLAVGNGGTAGTLGTGDVEDNADLRFNRSNTITVANNISGTGKVTQYSANTTILTGTNSYSGTTEISAGAIQIGNGGTTGTIGSGNVLNNSVLAFNRSNTLSIANDISGAGMLLQGGGGTTILTGTNSYSDATVISAGTLQIGDGGTIGTLGSGTVTNSTELVFNRSNGYTAANTITGSGKVTKNGSGTTILSGSNDYSNVTYINAGTLQIGDGGGTGTLGTNSVTNNAVLAFNRNNSYTVANNIAGSGKLVQSGSGTTVLTGSNSYTDLTMINSGTLQIGAGGTVGNLGSGSVTNSAALAFNRSNTMTVNNAISGTGTVRQIGSGRTILTGSSSYSGITTVANGELTVNGSISGSAVTVDNGAMLSGSGSVKTIEGAGTVSPGNSPGILTAESLDPSAGTDFNFEFTQTGSPTYNNALASGNDVLRLTSGTPFASALDGSNTVNIYLNLDTLAGNEVFRGAWYTDSSASFIDSIQNGIYNYWIRGDGNGSQSFNGVNYYSLASQYPLIQFTVSSVPDTADYSGGTVNGYVTQFSTSVIPEPGAMGTMLAAFAAAALRRRIFG